MKFTEHQFRTISILTAWIVVVVALVVLTVTGTLEASSELRTSLLTALGLLSVAAFDSMRVAVREQRSLRPPARRKSAADDATAEADPPKPGDA